MPREVLDVMHGTAVSLVSTAGAIVQEIQVKLNDLMAREACCPSKDGRHSSVILPSLFTVEAEKHEQLTITGHPVLFPSVDDDADDTANEKVLRWRRDRALRGEPY